MRKLYKYATLNDNLTSPFTTAGNADFIAFLDMFCRNATSHIEITVGLDSYKHASVAVNDRDPICIEGYNFGYRVQMFIRELEAINYFA